MTSNPLPLIGRQTFDDVTHNRYELTGRRPHFELFDLTARDVEQVIKQTDDVDTLSLDSGKDVPQGC
jgi:hypothetical protein